MKLAYLILLMLLINTVYPVNLTSNHAVVTYPNNEDTVVYADDVSGIYTHAFVNLNIELHHIIENRSGTWFTKQGILNVFYRSNIVIGYSIVIAVDNSSIDVYLLKYAGDNEVNLASVEVSNNYGTELNYRIEYSGTYKLDSESNITYYEVNVKFYISDTKVLDKSFNISSYENWYVWIGLGMYTRCKYSYSYNVEKEELYYNKLDITDNFIIEKAVTVLPQADSPTIPKVSP